MLTKSTMHRETHNTWTSNRGYIVYTAIVADTYHEYAIARDAIALTHGDVGVALYPGENMITIERGIYLTPPAGSFPLRTVTTFRATIKLEDAL